MNAARRHDSWERYAGEEFAPAQAGRPVPELARIGKRMRVLYEQVAQEPLPEHWFNLLSRLAKGPA